MVPAGLVEVADGRFHVASRLAETLEVACADKHLCCRVHLIEVEGVVDLVGVGPAKGVFPRVDVVVVGAPFGREARVEIRGHG